MLQTNLGEYDPSEARVDGDLSTALSGLAASFGGQGRERQYLTAYKYAQETQRRRPYTTQNVFPSVVSLASAAIVAQTLDNMFGAAVGGLHPNRYIDNNATTVPDLLGQYKGTPSVPKSIDAIRFKFASYLIRDTPDANIVDYASIKAFYDQLVLSQAELLFYPEGNAEPPWRGLYLCDYAVPFDAPPDVGWLDLPGAIDWSGIQAWAQVGDVRQGTGTNGTGFLIDPNIPAGLGNLAYVCAGAFEFRILPDGYPSRG